MPCCRGAEAVELESSDVADAWGELKAGKVEDREGGRGLPGGVGGGLGDGQVGRVAEDLIEDGHGFAPPGGITLVPRSSADRRRGCRWWSPGRGSTATALARSAAPALGNRLLGLSGRPLSAGQYVPPGDPGFASALYGRRHELGTARGTDPLICAAHQVRGYSLLEHTDRTLGGTAVRQKISLSAFPDGR